MKEKEIIEKYNLGTNSIYAFRQFLRNNDLKYSESFTGALIIDDSLIEQYIKSFREYKEEEERLKNEQKRMDDEEAARKKKAMAEMLITSGFSFDGYTIKKYSGYISGDDAISVNRGLAIFGSAPDVKDKLMESLVTIRRNALRELKEAAYALGCNAVIGVDFDYLTLDPQTANLNGGTTYQPYIFGVTANGNAVVIEKNN